MQSMTNKKGDWNLMSKYRSGFTIVELLIVIVVIGILAAITIVAFNGVQKRAMTASISTDLANASKSLKVFQVTNSGYPIANDCSASPAAGSICLKSSGATTYQYTASSSPQSFCITATNGTTSYFITPDAGPQSGGCAGHSAGGVATISNLMQNPSLEASTVGFITLAATIATTNTWSIAGSNSLLITPNATVAYSLAKYSLTDIVTPGKTYMLSATINTPVAQTGPLDSLARKFYVSWTSGGVTKTAVSGIGPVSGSGRISATFTLQSDATNIAVSFYNGATNSAANLVMYDGIMLTEGSTLYTYADGGAGTWAWNGDPNVSTSTGMPL